MVYDEEQATLAALCHAAYMDARGGDAEWRAWEEDTRPEYHARHRAIYDRALAEARRDVFYITALYGLVCNNCEVL